MKYKFFVLTILSCLSALSVRAQSSSTEGTEFYVTFTSIVPANNTTAQIRYVVAATCYITAQYGDGTYLDNHVQYAPGVYTKVVDKNKCVISSTSSGASGLMIHITSTLNIGVYAINMRQYTTDATAILPVATWGTDYTVISNRVQAELYNFITVIAPTDGTVFTIRNAAGAAVVEDQATDTDNPVYNCAVLGTILGTDLTGYTVESNHDVAVFSSSQAGLAATAGGTDHNYEQIYPANTAGKNFFLWNLSPSYADKVVILALEDNTTVTKKEGNSTISIPLGYHGTSSFYLNTAVRADNSAAPVMLTSNKPIIVNHILGHAPSIKWWSPVEQRITHAVITPFVPTGTSVINYHRLDIMIPNSARQDMIVRETRGLTTTTPALTFYTNISNPDYAIATLQYAKADNVLIELINPSGLIAYMTGYGNAESYIYTAGAGAYNLQNYFTVTTKTQPANDTYYSATAETSHTFAPADHITVKRTLERPFTGVSWLIHGAPYTGAPENANITNTLTIPAAALNCGRDSIVMSVRYTGATADSLYTGYVWIDNFATASSIEAGGNLSLCAEQPAGTTLTATAPTVSSPVFRWYASQTAPTPLDEGPSYTTPPLSATTTYYIGVSGQGICENKTGDRKEVTVSVAPCVFMVPVNPHLRSRVTR